MTAHQKFQLKVMGAYVLFSAVVLAFVITCLPGCGKQEQSLATGSVVQASALPLAGFRGDTAYAKVNAEALPALYANFVSVLSAQGLVKWDGRYDCNHSASLYIALAQAKFAVAAWHSSTPAQTLALAEYWYRLDRGGGHAIVAADTDRGLLFIEPQTGQIVTLSQVERNSAYLIKW